MKDIRREISDAFSDVRRPTGRRSIAPHECPECDELEKDLAQYTWNEVPSELIEYHSGDLALMSPGAFQYFLPAWLLRALDNPSGNVLEYTIFRLTPTEEQVGKDPKYFEERHSLLSPAQRRAIATFLEHVETNKLWEAFSGEFERGRDLWTA